MRHGSKGRRGTRNKSRLVLAILIFVPKLSKRTIFGRGSVQGNNQLEKVESLLMEELEGKKKGLPGKAQSGGKARS